MSSLYLLSAVTFAFDAENSTAISPSAFSLIAGVK